jgi:hypothetical protein
MHTGCWQENLKTEDHFEDLSLDMGTILIWILNAEDKRAWTELIWLRTETNGGLLWNTAMNFRIT